MTGSGQPSLTLLFEQAQQRLDRHYLTDAIISSFHPVFIDMSQHEIDDLAVTGKTFVHDG